MQLIRYAVISLSAKHRISLDSVLTTDGPVELRVEVSQDHSDENNLSIVVTARVAVQFDTATESHRSCTIPTNSRVRCEEAIMRVADLLAICVRASRTIMSPHPPVAFAPENEGEAEFLRGMQFQSLGCRSYSVFHTPLTPSDAASYLSDRWEGAALLAEAYSHNRLSGKFRDLVRFFEAAYGLPFMQLHKKLYQTLPPVMGYDRGEVKSWQALRHPFSHADGRVTLELAMEHDAWPIVQRMEQAAWFILFNKAAWRSASTARRNGVMPIAITTSPDRGGIIRQHSAPTLELISLDPFGAFQDCNFNVTPPAHYVIPDLQVEQAR